MNFLAHVLLSSESEESIVGALLGDFVKGRAKDDYPPGIRRGIELHRALDSFTDSHLLTAEARRLFPSGRRRMAGILIDVVNDHFLATNWQLFSEVPLDDFAAQVYLACNNRSPHLPERFQRMLPYMQRENWLVSYRELSWIRVTLERMAARREGRIPLGEGMEDIETRYHDLLEIFLAFFPEAAKYASEIKGLPAF